MLQSLFPEYVSKFFKIFATKINETINSTTALKYYFKTALTPKYSTDMKWGTLSINGRPVAADVVALDSSLPLKKRASIKQATGDIPKLGMKKYLNENTMNDILNLKARYQISGNASMLQQIIDKLFGDMSACAMGVDEMCEYLFLNALSSGVALVDSEDGGSGIGIRVDFQHPDSNKFGVTKPWSDSNADPIEDINNVLSQASVAGRSLRYMWMDRQTWNWFKANTKVKEAYAFFNDFAGSNVPSIPTIEKANAWLSAEYSLTIVLVDRNVTLEKDGKYTVVKPWADYAVVFTQSMNVGELQYSYLAEESFPVKNVDYQKVSDYILISKYSTNDPVREYTSSQAIVIPVLQDLDSIYIMNTNEATASEDAQTEGNSVYTYKGVDYTKASVIAAINIALGTTKAKSSNTDATLAKYIDQLSEEQIATFEDNIIED